MLNKSNTRDFYTLCMDPANFEAVTFKSRQAGDAQNTFVNYAVPRARTRFLDKDAPISDVQTSEQRYAFQIWQDALDAVSAPDPKVTDVIVDAKGRSYAVVIAENALCTAGTPNGNVWNLTVNQLDE